MALIDSRRALLTYALVSDALDKHNDFLLGLTPLFSIISEKRDQQLFNANQFAEDVATAFGIELPSEVAEFLQSRLQKEGFLKRLTGPQTTLAFVWTRPQNDRTGDAEQATARLDELLGKFEGFCQSFPSLTATVMSKAELENGLLDWVVANDRQLKGALSAIAQGEKVSATAKPRHNSEIEYLCASFVAHLRDNEPTAFEIVAQIANAALVSEAVLGVFQPPTEAKLTADMTAYLDAPFLMDMLGLSGPAPKEYADTLVQDLTGLGCKVAVFKHSIEEVRDNLKGLLSQNGKQRHGPTADAIRRNQVAEAYVTSVFHNVESHVQRISVPVLDSERTPLAANTHQFFGRQAEERLFQLLQPNYAREKARDRDIESIRVIIKRRAGHRTENVFRSRHVLVTLNDMLVTAATRLAQELGSSKRDVGPAIHRRKLAAALCLFIGPRQRANISRKRLFASCSSALAIRPEIVETIRSRLAQIDDTKASQFEILMNQPRFLQLAMDFTFADENVAANADVSTLFERLKSELTAEERSKSEKKLKDAKRKHAQDLATATAAALQKSESAKLEALKEVDAAREELARAKSKAADAAIQVERERAERTHLLRRRLTSQFRFWGWIRHMYQFVFVAIFVLATLTFSIFGSSEWLWKTLPGNVVIAVSALAAIGLTLMTLFEKGLKVLLRPIDAIQRHMITARIREHGFDKEVANLNIVSGTLTLRGGEKMDFKHDSIDPAMLKSPEGSERGSGDMS